MTFSIRDATTADLPMITKIYSDCVLSGTASYEITPPGLAEMANRHAGIVEKGYPYIVAIGDDGTFLGYAYASAFRTRPAYRWLVEDSIYIAQEARGRGVGKALLKELLARCEAQGFRQMVAVIGGASPASVALHRGLGFELTGTLKGTGFKHDKWLDTVLMQIALGEGNETEPDGYGVLSWNAVCGVIGVRLGDGTAQPSIDQLQNLVEYLEHLRQLMAALEDHPVGVDHRIGALLGRELGILLDPEQRHFAGTLEDRKHRFLAHVVDGVVLPLPLAHHAAVDPQDGIKLPTVKRNRCRIQVLAVFVETDDDACLLRLCAPWQIRLISHQSSNGYMSLA
jgi:phosphinothricin acetyltransferase